jgi:hypothetical protein
VLDERRHADDGIVPPVGRRIPQPKGEILGGERPVEAGGELLNPCEEGPSVHGSDRQLQDSGAGLAIHAVDQLANRGPVQQAVRANTIM